MCWYIDINWWRWAQRQGLATHIIQQRGIQINQGWCSHSLERNPTQKHFAPECFHWWSTAISETQERNIFSLDGQPSSPIASIHLSFSQWEGDAYKWIMFSSGCTDGNMFGKELHCWVWEVEFCWIFWVGQTRHMKFVISLICSSQRPGVFSSPLPVPPHHTRGVASLNILFLLFSFLAYIGQTRLEIILLSPSVAFWMNFPVWCLSPGDCSLFLHSTYPPPPTINTHILICSEWGGIVFWNNSLGIWSGESLRVFSGFHFYCTFFFP